MQSQGTPAALRRTISAAIPAASSSGPRKATTSTGSPSTLVVNSVLPRRRASQEITALAAARMCPVDRKFSSKRTWTASGKSRVKLRMCCKFDPRNEYTLWSSWPTTNTWR